MSILGAQVVLVGGTGSDAGKSMVVSGLLGLAKKAGLSVAPFKAQNMSLNSYVTVKGGEMGIAQAIQAKAAQIEPDVRMNPILLKPTRDGHSELIVLGKSQGVLSTREYYSRKGELFNLGKIALDELRKEYDLIVMEGAGSVAEINLWKHDLGNMPMAEYAGASVLLVADIDRGGAFASLAGCMQLFPEKWKSLVAGYVFNKFHGDPSLLNDGIAVLKDKYALECLGIIPFVKDHAIPREDSFNFSWNQAHVFEPPHFWGLSKNICLHIGIIKFPHASLLTDFEPLLIEDGVGLFFIEENSSWENLDAVILPGTKNTLADLNWLKECGLSKKLMAFKGPKVGVCGGMQIMGSRVKDHLGIEQPVPSEQEGLGLLKVETEFATSKVTIQMEAKDPFFKCLVRGFEIHYGRSLPSQPFYGQAECFGTYIHGLFDQDNFRHAFLEFVYLKKYGKKTKFLGRYSLFEKLEAFGEVLNKNMRWQELFKDLTITTKTKAE